MTLRLEVLERKPAGTLTYEQRRRWSTLRREARRSIVLSEGPSHPDFGRAFMQLYLPHYCSQEGRWIDPAEWHPALWAQVFGSLGHGEYHVTEAARGFAKTTTSGLAIPLATLGLSGLAMQDRLPYRFNARHYLWIVQDTGQQAKQSMDNLLAETEGNAGVMADFSHLTPALGKHKRPIADRDDDVVFNLNLRLQALGAGQKLRGRRHRQYRPDFAVVDDLENDEAVLTKYQRDKLDAWFSQSFLGALADGADVHFLGTPLHSDSLLRRLQGRPKFRIHRYAAARVVGACDKCADVDEQGQTRVQVGNEDCPDCMGAGTIYATTWQYRDQAFLATKRMTMGATAFSRELLLVVTDEERKRFPKRWMQWGERPTGDGVRCRIGVDPAVGEKKENDQTAIVAALRRRGDRRYHVQQAWAGRLRGKKIIERVVAMYHEMRDLGYAPVVCFEKVAAQAWGAQELEDLGIPVDPVLPSDIGGGDKLVRAEGPSVHYENGRVTHAAHLRDSEFEDELDQFPDGEHDDYVDALVYAIHKLEDPDSKAGEVRVVEHRVQPETGRDPEWRDPRYS